MPVTAPRTRGPYAKGVERREQILSTALEVFSEEGYHGSKEAVLAARDERAGEPRRATWSR